MSFLFACVAPYVFQQLFTGYSLIISVFLVKRRWLISFVRGTLWVKPSEFELSFRALINLLN